MMKNALDYPVKGHIKLNGTGAVLPVLDIPMMSDEAWQEMTRQHAVENYIKAHNGEEPESVDEACEWQRAWIAELEEEYERRA